MEEGQNFCLQWNSYQASVTGLFDSLRRDGELVDVTLCAQGQTIKVHRMMLSACSPYFRDVLKGDLGTHPVFFMRDMSFKDLSNIVEFMYRGKVNVAQSELGSFLKTAESLQVRGLTGDEEPAQQESPRKPKPAPAAPAPPPPQHPRLSPEPQRQRSQPESPRQRLPQPSPLPPPPPPPQQPQHASKRSHSPPLGGAPKLDGEARAGAPKRARSLEEVEQETLSVKQEPVAVDDGELSYLGGDNSAGSGVLSLSAEEAGAPIGFLGAGHPQSAEFHDEDLLAAVAGPSGFTQDQDGGATPGAPAAAGGSQPSSAPVRPPPATSAAAAAAADVQCQLERLRAQGTLVCSVSAPRAAPAPVPALARKPSRLATVLATPPRPPQPRGVLRSLLSSGSRADALASMARAQAIRAETTARWQQSVWPRPPPLSPGRTLVGARVIAPTPEAVQASAALSQAQVYGSVKASPQSAASISYDPVMGGTCITEHVPDSSGRTRVVRRFWCSECRCSVAWGSRSHHRAAHQGRTTCSGCLKVCSSIYQRKMHESMCAAFITISEQQLDDPTFAAADQGSSPFGGGSAWGSNPGWQPNSAMAVPSVMEVKTEPEQNEASLHVEIKQEVLDINSATVEDDASRSFRVRLPPVQEHVPAGATQMAVTREDAAMHGNSVSWSGLVAGTATSRVTTSTETGAQLSHSGSVVKDDRGQSALDSSAVCTGRFALPATSPSGLTISLVKSLQATVVTSGSADTPSTSVTGVAEVPVADPSGGADSNPGTANGAAPEHSRLGTKEDAASAADSESSGAGVATSEARVQESSEEVERATDVEAPPETQ